MDTARDVTLAPEAEVELAEILDYVALRNPLAAGALTARFDELFRSIAHAPHSGTRCRRDKRLRRRVLSSYIVYYVFDEPNDAILIIAIIHGARVRHRMRSKN